MNSDRHVAKCLKMWAVGVPHVFTIYLIQKEFWIRGQETGALRSLTLPKNKELYHWCVKDLTLSDSLMPSGLFESWLQEPFHLVALIPTFQLSGPYSCPISMLSLSQTPHLTLRVDLSHLQDRTSQPVHPLHTLHTGPWEHVKRCYEGIKALSGSVLINLVQIQF